MAIYTLSLGVKSGLKDLICVKCLTFCNSVVKFSSVSEMVRKVIMGQMRDTCESAGHTAFSMLPNTLHYNPCILHEIFPQKAETKNTHQ